MYFDEPRPEKHPVRLAIALAAALCINSALGAAIVNSGIDDRMASDRAALPAGAAAARTVLDLGTLPTVEVRAARVKA